MMAALKIACPGRLAASAGILIALWLQSCGERDTSTPRFSKVKSDLVTIGGSLSAYHAATGTWAQTDAEILKATALAPRLDPWGSPYVVRASSRVEGYHIRCAGPDRQTNTQDDYAVDYTVSREDGRLELDRVSTPTATPRQP